MSVEGDGVQALIRFLREDNEEYARAVEFLERDVALYKRALELALGLEDISVEACRAYILDCEERGRT